MPYTQYHISNDDYDTEIQNILLATPPQPTENDTVIIRIVCAHMRDQDVTRIIALTQYLGESDPEEWRARVPQWSDREARFVINCLRWEYYRARTTEALKLEDEERKTRETREREQEQQTEPPES
ncbi:hypothetical protein DOTSEDRAFT_24721 [Dothistroma septosporum NZE10]|uniref:Uncharacterized protein n=1 Tax=Dothistroma septosporum (strain NZE10 / CBS 128990) TaxID=675120 RepID=N1PMS0_DOTSN|nr:hypothetical protein DOTSEDRAFT_24721 [Dothistroma septosporum NZE10]